MADFICPLCSGDLAVDDRTGALGCAQGHSFDIARQGYASLVTGGSHIGGDTAAMAQARSSFLARGLYEPIADAITDLARHLGPNGRLADLGGGTGYYSSRVLQALPGWTGTLLDVSKAAAKIAAKIPRLAVATADLRRGVPLPTDSADLVLVVFAPRNAVEIERILTGPGRCVVVTPTDRHLAELRQTLPLLGIDPAKEDRLASQFSSFSSGVSHVIEYVCGFPRQALAEVVAMGPNAFHIADAAALTAGLPDELDVTVSVAIHEFAKSFHR